LGGGNIVYKEVTLKYRKFRQLNKLVATQNTSIRKILWISSVIIFKALYISFIQYMNNTVKKLDRNTFQLTYIINGTVYKAIVVPKKGPPSILQITDENTADITDNLMPYFNHLHAFNPNLNPAFFGNESLTFEYSDGTGKSFNSSENLIIPGEYKKMNFAFKKHHNKSNDFYTRKQE